MTNQEVGEFFLEQLPASNSGRNIPPRRYLLAKDRETEIGRDPSCQIAIDSAVYGMVSRRHAAIRPQERARVLLWSVCDLGSANGTYVNGQPLSGCQQLQSGDRLMLGDRGPEFRFVCPELPPVGTHFAVNANLASDRQEAEVSITQLFPIISTGRDLTKKAYLVPGILTVVFVVLMFATVGQKETAFFNQMLVATYLAGAAYYFVYQLCGKHKPWWVLFGSAIATALILLSPILPLFIVIFRVILPGRLPTPDEAVGVPQLLIRMFFGAGLMEELLKALPILAAYFIGRRLASPWRERVGVWEPLDGILLGTASAVGFTLLETLGQYVPEITRNFSLQAGDGIGQLVGFQLLVPRIIGSVAGHMAYSGYLGYFIGLSVLKPRQRWQILGVGYLTAAGLHALWNTTGLISGLFLAVVGVLSYAFLTAAILKARSLSPTRSQNFATRFIERP
ncbi:PrsW family glutamic-type intramembrane protease [Aliterella atlantica]|uniref:Signal peptide protein n=1 Tax=Aliterella atlantica CENA595 TaxID=1618023 RepID=A0A0D8ZQK8_9CYAN|nr:PrsW family glutamic-type intramembrane protease [Aliterella atlantica]KJH70754.1 signal peptide protein [Aliterella atlantica CENA595]